MLGFSSIEEVDQWVNSAKRLIAMSPLGAARAGTLLGDLLSARDALATGFDAQRPRPMHKAGQMLRPTLREGRHYRT